MLASANQSNDTKARITPILGDTFGEDDSRMKPFRSNEHKNVSDSTFLIAPNNRASSTTNEHEQSVDNDNDDISRGPVNELKIARSGEKVEANTFHQANY